MSNKIEIPLSKSKIFLLLIGAVTFIVFGILFTISPEYFITRRFGNPEIIRIVGIVAILFFGLCLVFITKKLFDNKIGLIIDKSGIINNSDATNIGLIEWNDITGIETIQIASTKILMLYTDKPEKYIERAKNGISKRAMKANYKMYGSPLSITSTSLKIKFNELEQLIINEIEKVKKQP